MANSLTRHAARRCAQRGISSDALAVVKLLGRETGDGLFLPPDHAARVATELHGIARTVERTGGLFLPMANGGRILSAYRAGPEKQRKLRRRIGPHDAEY